MVTDRQVNRKTEGLEYMETVLLVDGETWGLKDMGTGRQEDRNTCG